VTRVIPTRIGGTASSRRQTNAPTVCGPEGSDGGRRREPAAAFYARFSTG